MSRATPRNRAITFRLPYRALWITMGAFMAGLLLFGIVWVSDRKDDTFYTVKPADKSGEAALIEPLPEPLNVQNTASGMQAPAPGAAAESQASDGASAFPKPMLEDLPASTASAETDAAPKPETVQPVQPAPTALADRVTPLPIDGQSPPPTYPTGAMRRGETGTSVVRIQVDAQGLPSGVALIQRSGSRELDRAAMEAVRKWHFQPAIEDGQPIAGSVDIPVEFNLQR